MSASLRQIPLSPCHETVYHEWTLNPANSDCHIVVDNEMRGELDVARLDRALERLSEDYFLLHSVIRAVGEICYWVEQDGKRVWFDYFDAPLSDDELLSYVTMPFDLTADVLLRTALIRQADRHFRIVLVFHQLIMDGSKENFIYETIPYYYNNPDYRFAQSIEEQCNRLVEFSRQCSVLLQSGADEHRQFWFEQLAGHSEADLRFLTVPGAPAAANGVGEQMFCIDAETLKKMRSAAKKTGTTPYLLSLAVFSALLFRYSGQEKTAICIPVSIPEAAEFIYGSNVNCIVFASHLRPSTTVLELIDHVRSYFRLIKSGRHYYFPIQKMACGAGSGDLQKVGFNQTGLKNRMFNFALTVDETVNSALNIDLTGQLLFAQEIKNNQTCYRVLFRKNCICPDLLHNFIQTFQRVQAEILDDLLQDRGTTPISRYSLLDECQRDLVTRVWNGTARPYPHKTLHQLFEEQENRTPNGVALEAADKVWTYTQLNQSANKLAHYLKGTYGTRTGDLIGLCFKPGRHMVVALLAVLKAGAAYVPMDPASPDERVDHILRDTNAAVVITDRYCAYRFSTASGSGSVRVINMDTRHTEYDLNSHSRENLRLAVAADQLAYVIYTDSSAGQSKGVLVEHRSVVNYVSYLIDFNQLSANSVGAKCASFSFDGSVIEIYPILLSGAKLCVIKDEDRLICKKVNEFFYRHGVTYAYLAAPLVGQFFELNNTCLKTLITCDDRSGQFIPQSYQVIHAYGYTEATVQATMYTPDDGNQSMLIGRPINNVNCYVADPDLNLLPVGAIGELLIGGDGLARKYLNLPELTAARFIRNPFQSEQELIARKNGRLYRTGDLVRWLADGNLQYIGSICGKFDHPPGRDRIG